MKLNVLAKFMLCLVALLALEKSGFAQTKLTELAEKKTKWRAIVTKRLPGVLGWDAAFPTERGVDPKRPETYGTGGDSLMYNALLCGVGEGIACDVIPNSLESSGQLRRNPLLKDQPSNSKYGPLSKDHTMATLYWLSLPDTRVPAEKKRNFALNWQKSFNQKITTTLECDEKDKAYCLNGSDIFDRLVAMSPDNLSSYVPGLPPRFGASSISVETLKKGAAGVEKGVKSAVDSYKDAVVKGLETVKGCVANDRACVESYIQRMSATFDTIGQFMANGAKSLQSCLSSDKDVEKCVRTNIEGGQDYVKGVLAAISICRDGLREGIEEKDLEEAKLGRCAVNLVATVLALPRFCNDINCVLPPTQMAYVNKIWGKLGLQQPFNSALFDLLGVDSEEATIMFSKFDGMNEANLAALNILVRRNLGLKSSRMAGRLINRQPNNPFFQWVHSALKDSLYTKEAIANVVIDQCQSIETYRRGQLQYLADRNGDERKGELFDHQSYWRWKTPEQDEFTPQTIPDSDMTVSERISMVWDCIYMADALGVPEYTILGAAPLPSIVQKVKKNENPTVYDTVAKFVNGGVPPLKFQLTSQPANFQYFTFDPETGIFIYRPTNSYSSESIEFTVTDRIGMTAKSKLTIAFDHSEIYPGHPPLTQTPTRPLPAAIYPLITLTNQASNQVRTLNDTDESPTELMTIAKGTLDLQAEAYIENVDETYTGNMDCTIDWTSKGNTPALIKDTDEYPRNFFIQKSIDVTSLEPYQVTVFRMNCMAPDMPIITRDIPVVYTPDTVGLVKAMDKVNFTYASTDGATLALTFDKTSSSDFNRVYSYNLKAACGHFTGNLVAATNVNKLTINGAFDGLLANGDQQKIVWLNAPLCDKVMPIVWKLVSASSTPSGGKTDPCNLKSYPTKDGMSLAKPSNFDGDMNACAKAVKASDWSCSWVSADKTWIIPALKSVVFTADRWGASKYNIFSFDTVKRNGCADPEMLLKPQTNSCNLSSKGYKTTDSTGNTKPSSFAGDMAQCGSKVKAADWSCSWVSADESWIIPTSKTVIFTANRWGADKYNVFTFDTVRRNGCKNPDLFK